MAGIWQTKLFNCRIAQFITVQRAAHKREESKILFVFDCKPKYQNNRFSELILKLELAEANFYRACMRTQEHKPIYATPMQRLHGAHCAACRLCHHLFISCLCSLHHAICKYTLLHQLQTHSFTSFVIAKWHKKPYQSVPVMRKT